MAKDRVGERRQGDGRRGAKGYIKNNDTHFLASDLTRPCLPDGFFSFFSYGNTTSQQTRVNISYGENEHQPYNSARVQYFRVVSTHFIAFPIRRISPHPSSFNDNALR